MRYDKRSRLLILPLLAFACVAGIGLGSTAIAQPAQKTDPAKLDIVVWSGDKPTGKTWAHCGPTGYLKTVPKAGMIEGTSAIELHMDGDGYRGAGLNWKGWFPADAGDDVSRCTALVFFIRQVTKVENADLTISLVDNLKREKGTAAGNSLSVTADGGLETIDGNWRRVVMPLNRFTQSKPLRLDRLWEIEFSNTGSRTLTFQIDRIGFSREKVRLPRFKSGPAYAARAAIDLSKPLHTISDGIYGVCGLPREKLSEFHIAVTRWGGNPSSRYNWRLGVDNAGSDWYFRNRGKLLVRLTDTGYLKQIENNQVFGATTYQTIPMIGWVAKDDHSYAYSVAKYGAQKGTEPGQTDVGNGVRADGTLITNNDPRDTSVASSPEFVGEAVAFVVRRAGKATGSPAGVKYWALDNEPMLWNSTHRDVHPDPLSYDELWARTVQYAEAIKKADPTAKVAGFCNWGWTDLYYSAKDEGSDRYKTKADFTAHGKMPLAEWFIKKCGDYKKEHGKALVDVFDTHWYPQGQVKGQGAHLGRGMNPELNEYRLRSTRDLWDRHYDQEKGISWIRDSASYSPVALLPRIRAWIDKHNPGMELCLGEYNFGGADNIGGGLAQAETFGVLARERLDLAFIWHTPQGTQELAWKLFRSYDGKSNGFGEEFLGSRCDHADLSIFAARRTRGGAVTIVVINKNLHGDCEMNLEANGLTGRLRMWRFDQESGEEVVEVRNQSKDIDGRLTYTAPAASATMLVVIPAKGKD